MTTDPTKLTYRLDREHTETETDPMRHTFVFKPHPMGQQGASLIYLTVRAIDRPQLEVNKFLEGGKTYTLAEINVIRDKYGLAEPR